MPELREKGGTLIWKPKPGMIVELRYQRSARATMPHGLIGIIIATGKGPGPITAAVKIGDNVLVVPRGNLFEKR